MSTRQIIEADATWTGPETGLEPGVRVAIGDSGRIEAVGRLTEPPTHRLTGRALLPGFVNAHSHAFQRGLRGLGETFPAAAGSFWTWREAMYDLVGRMTPALAEQVSRAAFEEMLDAGITTVGEFHYLHHASDDERDWQLDEAIRRAAAAAGIRLVLLQTAYFTGGIDAPLAGGQRRFDGGDVATFLERFDALRGDLDPSREHAGLAAHSIRAVDLDGISALHEAAAAIGVPMHLHLEEQPAEIEACRKRYGTGPVRAVVDRLPVDRRLTAVHATHTTVADLEAWCGAGGNVCLCPLTEANLGDGLADGPGLLAANASISLGTDSNARISMLEEMRWMEYGQRLRGTERGVFRDRAGRIVPSLLRSATEEGGRSLGVDVGRIAPGWWADFAVLDLASPVLTGFDGGDADPLVAAVLGGGDDTVVATCVGGRWRGRRTRSAVGAG